MKIKNKDMIMQNKIFIWIGLATAILLLIPFFLMQFKVQLPDPGSSPGVINWTLSDFVLMGILIYGFASLFVLLARKIRRHRLVIAVVVSLAFLWLWAELAVGIFTNWGS